MPAQLSGKEVRERLDGHGLTMLSSYKNADIPMRCKDGEGFIRYTILDSLLHGGHKSKRFTPTNSDTIYNINLYLEKNDIDLKVISGNYNNRRSLLKLKDFDNYWYQTCWDYLRNGGLPLKFHKANPYSIRNIKHFMKLNNIECELLSDNYINSQTKLKFRCTKRENHGIFYKDWNHFRRGQRCPECKFMRMHKKFADTQEEFIEKAKEMYGNEYDYSKVEYTRSRDKVEIICDKHGSFYIRPNGHLRGRGCPKCSWEKVVGIYNEASAEKYKDEWKDIEAKIYYIKCFDENEEFYKVGITRNSIKERFRSNNTLPYEYELIGAIDINLYDAVSLEKDILSDRTLYEPNKRFTGCTECFKDELEYELYNYARSQY